MHTPLAPWIRNIQVIIRDTIRSGVAIHAPYAPHVRHPFGIDTQLKRNTCEIVAPEMFHQTISAILLRICSFFRTPYERNGFADQWNRGIMTSAKLSESTSTFLFVFFFCVSTGFQNRLATAITVVTKFTLRPLLQWFRSRNIQNYKRNGLQYAVYVMFTTWLYASVQIDILWPAVTSKLQMESPWYSLTCYGWQIGIAITSIVAAATGQVTSRRRYCV